MRFHVAHLAPDHPGEGVERADLVDDVGAQLVAGHVHRPAAEPGQVAVADLGADPHIARGRDRADPQHRDRVTGVEAAGHVRAGDHVEQGVVVAEGPDAEALAEIGVEIDLRHAVRLAAQGLVEGEAVVVAGQQPGGLGLGQGGRVAVLRRQDRRRRRRARAARCAGSSGLMPNSPDGL